MPLEKPSDKEFDVHELIAAQRKLMNSKHPFEQVVCTLWVAGTLKRRLAQLEDRQIGQLLWDHVLDHLTLFGPDAAICEHAIRRLLRSGDGGWEEQDDSMIEAAAPACPACGSETVYNVGIDEPDFLLCMRAECEHKESLGVSGGKEG